MQRHIKLLTYVLHLEGFLGLSYLLTGDAHAAHAAFANLVQTAQRLGVGPLPVPTLVQV